MRNKDGRNTIPWITPLIIGFGGESESLYFTICLRSSRYEADYGCSRLLISKDFDFMKSLSCETLSKASLKSKNIANTRSSSSHFTGMSYR